MIFHLMGHITMDKHNVFFVPGDTHHLYIGKWWYKNGT
jgi:hypothetical protein